MPLPDGDGASDGDPAGARPRRDAEAPARPPSPSEGSDADDSGSGGPGRSDGARAEGRRGLSPDADVDPEERPDLAGDGKLHVLAYLRTSKHSSETVRTSASRGIRRNQHKRDSTASSSDIDVAVRPIRVAMRFG